MSQFPNTGAGDIVLAMAQVIIDNRAYLSEIDGKIGDGDHGVNMAKGFGMAAQRITPGETSLSGSLDILGTVLMTEIGGSMGPLYGIMFTEWSESISGLEFIDAEAFGKMLTAGLKGVESIGSAKVGDKTLLDTLVPALTAFNDANEGGKTFAEALAEMVSAAERGRDSTLDMVAKVGRSSRLGERSRGVLDAGATSCAVILKALGEGSAARMVEVDS